MKRLESFILGCFGVFVMWCFFAYIRYTFVNDFVESVPMLNFFEAFGAVFITILGFACWIGSMLLAAYTLFSLFFDEQHSEKEEEKE